MKSTYCSLILCFLLFLTGCSQLQPVSVISDISSVSSSDEAYSSKSTSESDVLKSGDYRYKITDNSVLIIKYFGKNKEVVIPDTIDGLPVKVIGESAFEENKDLESVKITDSVVLIETAAFKYCWNLKVVELGKGVEKIEDSAFSGCSFENINLGENLKEIGAHAFDGCSELKSIIVPDSVVIIGEGAFSEPGIII